ncbi:MAG: glycosyltransferase family 39 protein, partial [Patescibacteria group bacterium]|nr:glycosyltransferase family 39 protein [Patescibacteria group bacterium]
MIIFNLLNSLYNNGRYKKYAINLTIILFLFISNLMIGQYFRNNLEDVLWNSDAVIHISVAHSFQVHKTFDLTFLQNNPSIPDADNFIVSYPSVIQTYYDKGPVYYVLLGSFYQLLGTTPNNFYFHASIFNNILVWVFLVLFFFFIKNKFNLQTAFFSSILVLFTPYTAWIGSGVLLYFPFMIFCLAALFFLGKKKKHYFLFGIFTGLACLTHPYGIFIGSAYCLFLLINREFRGFLITFAAWNLTLLPWLMR